MIKRLEINQTRKYQELVLFLFLFFIICCKVAIKLLSKIYENNSVTLS